MTPTIKVLMCDDHPVVLAGLGEMLASGEDIEVIGAARDGEEAVEISRRLQPDVILMDLQMPNMDGATAISRIREERPETRILVLTTFESEADVVRAIEAGAAGYLLKDTPKEQLFSAIRDVAGGNSPLSPGVGTRLTRRMQRPDSETLTTREVEVIELLSRGTSNREIAKELWISETTVKGHLLRAFDKLGVRDRTSAVTEALRRGIIRLD